MTQSDASSVGSPERVADSGLVVVDKPAGMTSHDVVSRVRRTLGTRKVGHAGTLDPMATGVLVLGFGRATRLLGHLLLKEKTYRATVRLGAATTTDDAEGEVTASTSANHVTEQEVRSALTRFEGEIEQVPSSVSAIKVDGRRAYDLAREGEEVELEARRVTISAIEVGEFRREGEYLDCEVRVACSSGTYIRAIARDLGSALGVGGHLTALRRTSVGPFVLDEANTDLDHLFGLSIADAARRSFPAVDLDEQPRRRRPVRPAARRAARRVECGVRARRGVPRALRAPRRRRPGRGGVRLMQIFHIALAAEWEAAHEAGSYTTSTRGRSLAEVGFIHCSHEDQWRQVRRDVYGDETAPLVMLVIDTDRLTAPLRVEDVPGSDRPFPHVYGPLNLDAVVEVWDLALPGTSSTDQ